MRQHILPCRLAFDFVTGNPYLSTQSQKDITGWFSTRLSMVRQNFNVSGCSTPVLLNIAGMPFSICLTRCKTTVLSLPPLKATIALPRLKPALMSCNAESTFLISVVVAPVHAASRRRPFRGRSVTYRFELFITSGTMKISTFVILSYKFVSAIRVPASRTRYSLAAFSHGFTTLVKSTSSRSSLKGVSLTYLRNNTVVLFFGSPEPLSFKS